MSDCSSQVPHQLKAVAEKVEAGERVTETVRTLLSWFDAQRRGIQIAEPIAQSLACCKLFTDPEFTEIWIDGEIEFKKQEAKQSEDESIHPENCRDVGSDATGATSATTSSFDPTYRIGRLPAANQPVTGVAPDADIAEAITIMMHKDYSQLPVWINDRNVRGMISWKSLGSRVALKESIEKVRFCVEPHRTVSSDTPLFDVIPQIVDDGYVLVTGPDRSITGIVTASDLSLEFRQLAEPFLLLSEIEQHLRKIIGNNVPLADIQNASDPSDNARRIEKISDLSLGGLIRLLENSRTWDLLNMPLIHRKIVVQDLHKIRAIRNEVMHFDPDPLDPGSIEILWTFPRFLRRLDRVRTAGTNI